MLLVAAFFAQVTGWLDGSVSGGQLAGAAGLTALPASWSLWLAVVWWTARRSAPLWVAAAASLPAAGFAAGLSGPMAQGLLPLQQLAGGGPVLVAGAVPAAVGLAWWQTCRQPVAAARSRRRVVLATVSALTAGAGLVVAVAVGTVPPFGPADDRLSVAQRQVTDNPFGYRYSSRLTTSAEQVSMAQHGWYDPSDEAHRYVQQLTVDGTTTRYFSDGRTIVTEDPDGNRTDAPAAAAEVVDVDAGVVELVDRAAITVGQWQVEDGPAGRTVLAGVADAQRQAGYTAGAHERRSRLAQVRALRSAPLGASSAAAVYELHFDRAGTLERLEVTVGDSRAQVLLSDVSTAQERLDHTWGR